MKVFCDFHHAALLRSMIYLFADRLGHELHLATVDCGVALGAVQDGTWGTILPEKFPVMGLTPEETKNVRFCSEDDFRNGQWDVMVLTRPESARIFQRAGHPKKGTVYVGVSGNEGTGYDWNWVTHFIATDLNSWHSCPSTVKKVHVPQELGRQFDDGQFHPVRPSDFCNIGSFTNNLKGFDQFVEVRCNPKPVNIWTQWQELKELLPSHRLTPYGHSNDSIGGACIEENYLPSAYQRQALVWHHKTYEGYGHSLLQSLPAGRPVLVPRGFYSDRTAGRFLIPGKTCIETSYDAKDVAQAIRDNTQSLDQVNDFAYLAYRTFKASVDWAFEADKVRAIL